MAPITRKWLVDAAERTGLTFLETFAAITIAAGTDAINMGTLKAAGVSAFAAALAFAKAAIAKRVNEPDTASLAPGV